MSSDRTTRSSSAAGETDFQRIALLLGQDVGYCRGVLRGVQAFANPRCRWIFRTAAPSTDVATALREWKPAGIIAHLYDPAVAKALIKLKKPIVNVTSTLSLDLPLAEVDHLAVGQMAADYFLDGGFKSFGYFGSARAGFSVMREEGFRRRLEERGFSCSSHHAEYLPRPDPAASWKDADDSVRSWLLSLPKPIAIFSSNDVPARELAEVCRLVGLKVPEQVALLGVDDDKLECGLAFPPLSSIALPAERVGFEAAQMLAKLMDGQPLSPARVFLQPKGVVVRQSSDIVAVQDESVSQALSFIRQNAMKPIGVEDVLREVTVSRRKLERAFQQVLHRSIFEEIRRLRIEKAKLLLATTEMSIPQIAARSGLENARRMAVVFRRLTDMTPTAYRAQYRSR